jgi:hypothetical protein
VKRGDLVSVREYNNDEGPTDYLGVYLYRHRPSSKVHVVWYDGDCAYAESCMLTWVASGGVCAETR